MPDYSDLYSAAVPVLPPGQNYNPQSFLPGGYTPPRYAGNPNQPMSGATNGRGFLGDMGFMAGPGAQQLSDLTSGNFNMWDAMDPTGLLSGLFGGGGNKPSFNPYIKNGQVYSTDPNKAPYQNPTPVSNVPGANQQWKGPAVGQANQIRTLQTLLPYLLDATNKGKLQNSLSDLGISQATSPGYAQLMTQLFNQYGPQLNAIGNAINRQNALAQANTERQVMAGPGADLVNQAYGLSQVFDKPYYDTRATTAGRLQDLLGSINLNGGLSDTERNEIAQGLARDSYARGTANAPSATETVANAMQYGQAGYQRKVQQQSLLGSAISTASSFLPTAKSGVDVFQVATGRPSTTNQGAGQFTGVQQPDQTANNVMSGLMGNMTGLQGQQNQFTLGMKQINAQKKDWADYLGQVMGSVGNLAGGVAGAALCWVAREVYGEENPKWMLFRTWLMTKAPNWLLRGYIKFGPKIAHFISDKPLLKSLIRKWMDKRICQLKEQDLMSFGANLTSKSMSMAMLCWNTVKI